MNLEAQLDELRSVVRVVVDETPRTSQRVRLLAPWVDAVRRRGASWRQLVPVLQPVCALPDAVKTETRLSQIFAVSSKRRPKSPVDYDAWRGAVAEAAGVALPATARPVDSESVVVPARLLGLLEKMAEGMRPVQVLAGQAPRGRAGLPTPAVATASIGSVRPDGNRSAAPPSIFVAAASTPSKLSEDEINRAVEEGRAADEAASIAAAREKMGSSSRSFGVRTVPPIVGGPNLESRND